MWKVVKTDNYDRDHISDELVVDEIGNKACAEKIAELINLHRDPHGPDYYTVYPQDQKLKKFEP